MKFWEIFRFEFRYQLRRAWPWLIVAALLALDFLMARDASLADALYEDFFANSPFNILKTTVIGGLIWLLLAPSIAGEAAARDVATGMHPLTYTASASKAEYLGGRFLAALAINALLLLGVQAGILLGAYSSGMGAGVLGPFRPKAYLTAYAYISLPNAFVATALQFSLALRTGRTMAGYLGSLFLVFMSFFVASMLLFKRSLGTLLDPIGMRFVVEDVAHEWTTHEKSWRLLALEGAVLTNRLLWLGIAVGVLAVTCVRFRFAHRTASSWWKRRARAFAPAPAIGVAAGTPVSVPQVTRTFGVAGQARRTLAIAGISFRALASSWAGLAMLTAIPMMAVLVVLSRMGSMGTPLVPTTGRVLMELTGGLSAELAAEPNRWVIVPLLIAFFAGELVWREREAGLGELTDAMPGSEWAPFLGKLLGLGLLLALFMALLTAAGMLAQALLGHREFQIGLYVRILFGLQLPEYLLFAVLAMVVHVLVDQKYVGHLVAIMAYMFIAVLAAMLGIEHNLLVYGAGPAWSYTDMRGFGVSLAPWAWFKLYWAAWALLLAVVARLLWVRGKERGVGVRIRLARRRITRSTALAAGVATALMLTLGAFIFYNTNVLNRYVSRTDSNERRAAYERRYRRYERVPQPELAGTSLRVEIYPTRRAVDIRGTYRLANRSTVPIDSIHLVTVPGIETDDVGFDRPAVQVLADQQVGYRIYALEQPLQPGDSLRLDFSVRVERRGFGNRGIDPSVATDGSYFNSGWFPFVGYQRSRELLGPADRREHGLAPRPILASLYDVEGNEPASRAGGVTFEAVVGTEEDQVAVAPGALRRTWAEGGRRYFAYATDAPIGKEWAFFSARYAVHEGRWNDVAIRVFHHPEHGAHLDRMMRSVRASLDYYTKQFSPYPYRHLSIVEHPGAAGIGAHADASLISHGQGFPFWTPKDQQRRLDFPYWVVAHEMAHQWTVPYALVEGLPFLAEGLANYFAMQVVKVSRGEAEFRRVVAFMRQPYPYRPIRRGEPLLRALDPYLSRRRGPFAMYALGEYIGSDRVNHAIRRLIETHDAAGVPPATTLDLYRELQAVTPDSLRYLLHDLFEVNTIWELKTERATAKQAADSLWQVTLDVRARKVVYDSAGVETDVPMDEWVPIGIFGAAEGRDELGTPLYAQRHRIRDGTQRITVTVPNAPALAGIDPYHVLDWGENDDDGKDDNLARLTIEGPVPAP